MSGTETRRVAFDTNALIELVERITAAGQQLRRLLTLCRDHGTAPVVSELALAEVLVRPFRNSEDGKRDIYFDLFSDAGVLDVRPVDRWTLIADAHLKAANIALKLPDAVHAATALSADVDVFLTSDRRLGRLQWPDAVTASGGAPPTIVDPLAVDVTTLVVPR